MKPNIARALSTAGMLLATSAVGMFDGASNSPARIMPPPGCGFIPLPQPVGDLTARYYHCADSFILIKYHWSGGGTGTACVPPWYQRPFYRSGDQVVVNAYYVTTPPNLMGPPGNRMCRTGQPQV